MSSVVRKTVPLPTTFLQVKVGCSRKYDYAEFRLALIMAMRQMYGALGATQVDPDILSFDDDSQSGVISAPTEAAVALRGALTLFSIDGNGLQVRLHVVRTASSLLSLAHNASSITEQFFA